MFSVYYTYRVEFLLWAVTSRPLGVHPDSHIGLPIHIGTLVQTLFSHRYIGSS